MVGGLVKNVGSTNESTKWAATTDSIRCTNINISHSKWNRQWGGPYGSRLGRRRIFRGGWTECTITIVSDAVAATSTGAATSTVAAVTHSIADKC